MLREVDSFNFFQKKYLILGVFLFVGFLLRLFFVDKFTEVSGDLLLYADWGEKFWQYGGKSFYFIKDWYYAPPNYPPIISLIYAFSYWLFDHKYVLAQIHNVIKIYPSEFIEYFYKNGYYLLLKLPAIFADLSLSLIIYKLIYRYTNNFRKSFLGLSLYLFNPVTILLSSIWGQTDSLVSLFALLSFLLLIEGKYSISIVLYFISLYTKPNWIYLAPLYIFIFFRKRFKVKDVILGAIIVAVILLFATLPFSNDVLGFNYWLFQERILKTAILAQKVSINAFNFYAVFFRIDITSDSSKILGITFKTLSYFLYGLVIFASTFYLRKKKFTKNDLLVSIFILGFGSYLFLTNMLERYFFAAFVPLIVIALIYPKNFKYFILINIAVFANIVFAFFRRKYGFVADFFYANNYLWVRIFSLINLVSWILIIRSLWTKKDDIRI